MINKEKLEALKHAEHYNNDPLLKDVFQTLENLFNENERLKKALDSVRWDLLKGKETQYP